MIEATFRRARADEADMLDEMTLAGIRYWGHHERFPEAYRELADNLPTSADIEEHLTFVVEEAGDVVAFYELREHGEDAELLRMFPRVDRIGKGYGRLMWNHAVEQAAAMGDRMLIMSDPEAVGFYAAMGAVLEKKLELASGMSLGVMWYDLTSPRP